MTITTLMSAITVSLDNLSLDYTSDNDHKSGEIIVTTNDQEFIITVK